MYGYLHQQYAQSLSEFGQPIELPCAGGWLLKRRIPNTEYYDAMGCYPFFACSDWSQLQSDLEALADDLVSVALVTDPFGEYSQTDLGQCFNDVMFVFKHHYIVDLHEPTESFISKHHRYYAHKALKKIQIEVCTDAIAHLDQWVKLYQILSARHNLKGIKAFSRDSFKKQLVIPGMVMIKAIANGEIVGMHLWYVQGDVVYSHLAASSPQGYEIGAAYAIHLTAIEYFKNHARWLHLGAGAGTDTHKIDGLSRFKKGWATDIRSVYFCGQIFQRDQYTELVDAKAIVPGSYFPLYRSGEF